MEEEWINKKFKEIIELDKKEWLECKDCFEYSFIGKEDTTRCPRCGSTNILLHWKKGLKYEKTKKTTTSQKLLDKVQYEVKEKYGFIPKSVLSFKKVKELVEFVDDTSILRNVVSGVAKKRGGGFAKTYKYSMFNPSLAEFLIRQYMQEGYAVLDPFCGRGTRGLIVNKNKCHYVGIDISPLTIKVTQELFERRREHEFFNKEYETQILLGDGITLEVIGKQFDAIFTCPPYWNAEIYEDVPGQLSSYRTYEMFVDRYKKCFRRFYEVLNYSTEERLYPFIIVTGNIRDGKHGIRDLTTDTHVFAREAGFILHDVLIHENISPFVYMTFRRNEAKKIVAKVHETISVFKKVR
jgi:DNA modification methylase